MEQICIGIDIGRKAKHVAVICTSSGQKLAQLSLGHTIAELENLLRRSGWPETPVTVVMEPTGNLHKRLAQYFSNQPGVTVHIVKTLAVHDLRVFLNRHTKTDAIDAFALSRVPILKPTSLDVFTGVDAARLKLDRLCREREKSVDTQGRCMRRIEDIMELANPGVLDQLSSCVSKSGQKLLSHGVNPFQLCRTGFTRVDRMLRKESRGQLDSETVKAILTMSKRNCQLVSEFELDYAGLEAEMKREVKLFQFLAGQKKEIEEAMAGAYLDIDPHQTLLEIPGVGPLSAAAFEASLGRPGKFRNIRAIRMFVGVAPRKHNSGESNPKGQSMTKAGPRHIRRLLYLCAETARKQDPQMAALYHRLMVKGGRHHYQASGAVMSDLLNRIYAVMKRREQNGTATYEWRNCAGEPVEKAVAQKIAGELQVPPAIRAQRRKKVKGNRWSTIRSRSEANATVTPIPAPQRENDTQNEPVRPAKKRALLSVNT